MRTPKPGVSIPIAGALFISDKTGTLLLAYQRGVMYMLHDQREQEA